jgi:hypothetical protein
MRLLLLLQYLTSALALTTADLTGTWHQVYSNAYIQATTEIDWHCVRVDIAEGGDGEVVVVKQASLHGGPQNVTTPAFRARLVDGHRLAPAVAVSNLRGAAAFDLHPYPNDTLVVTGVAEPALFVWTREGKPAPPAGDVEVFAKDLGFLPVDPAYALVGTAYNATACGGDVQDIPRD